MEEIELIATSTFGLESIVKKEVKDLGYHIINVQNGKIVFKGDLKAICRANIWLRCAERVQLKVGEFKAITFDDLYEKTYSFPWDKWLPEHAAFPVSGKSVKSKLHSVPACQSIVKKAIVDKLKTRYHCSWFEEDGPVFPIQVAIHKDIATLTIDTSGDGLHKRGYRELVTKAPLQETIAAAMIYLSKWNEDRILIDPFCGSGTIPIETAMIGKNIAPGLNREFVSEKWPCIGQKLWKEAREEARDLIKDEFNPRLIMGTDRDENVIGIARHHSRKAGVADYIHFQQRDFSDFSTSRKYGYIITNPPYGERLSERSSVEKLYREMGRKLKPLDTWSFYILTSHSRFENFFGKRASKRRKLYNGGIECQYYQYYGPWPPRT
ncbi:THUMP domain-containing class I SAM-dependent RNA methyltransferase [Halothermothrix orenii]|uniref:Putative RNA methylase n=1 Tax=Halothermothrix orenii (strain H 168 / OCM 544 / DSM 9562) TaxID=373903 RepID=B8CWE7_HALOH|nr:class I SAM-dependent RNA methyltransferase [Halothermothrix orenii]ACL69616.1 putative RNA methylase [Halothermothrix orenii H 168]